jgi:hypothetical protein
MDAEGSLSGTGDGAPTNRVSQAEQTTGEQRWRPGASPTGRVKWFAVFAMVGWTAACAGTPWQGSLRDPAALTFTDELGVDLSTMQQVQPGLYVKDMSDGVGAEASRTSRVGVHYAVWLPDGTLVDTSMGGEPFQFRLGGNEVIRAWNEGIPGMKVGGVRRLVVRPGLAYGSQGQGDVPPNATLVFEVQLMSAG